MSEDERMIPLKETPYAEARATAVFLIDVTKPANGKVLSKEEKDNLDNEIFLRTGWTVKELIEAGKIINPPKPVTNFRETTGHLDVQTFKQRNWDE